ncbi:MAG: 2-hydroxyacyl-CoA dehydratase [Desulfobacterales bacterium]|nr:2-hydroxyacyl-CoA dehydratase [Desulfobacterales bacterium]
MTKENKTELIGFTCAYTPLAVIDAAGYAPFRVLPVGESPDQAGSLLHDNLCPHVKRILDRAFAGDLPDMAGMVFINSCDAMRRLADAWQKVRPDDPVIPLDLPATPDEYSVSYFAGEIKALADTLSGISGHPVDQEQIRKSITRYNELSAMLANLKNRVNSGVLTGGSPRMQEFYNRASTEPADQLIAELSQLADESEPVERAGDSVPVFLFGNVLPDTEAFSLFESCGAHIADDDFCTGSRLFSSAGNGPDQSKDVFVQLAENILSQPPCARTFDPSSPGKMGRDILSRAKDCNAKGVIGHALKFCDPYLVRLPLVRDIFRDEGIPLLLLEGDCTLRSIGQHRTRIEAFIEMLR